MVPIKCELWLLSLDICYLFLVGDFLVDKYASNLVVVTLFADRYLNLKKNTKLIKGYAFSVDPALGGHF
jgi:hypothetical protein